MENPLGQSFRELPGPLLLTGHTGFKGTWMTFLLEHLNVPVVGYSLPPEKDSLFDRAGRTGAISEVFGDIRDYETLEKFIIEKKPSTIIHMAAQPLVFKSYENPRETFDVNVMGTVNVLDIAFKQDFVKAVIVVTTDKVYRNDNLGRAFLETDPLRGKDPYSASKVGVEAVIAAWQQIARVSGGPKIVSVRGGNVIGGGDFAENRIIPDLVRGVINKENVEVRNPHSTRPWQHVLDPISGYLIALNCVLKGDSIESLNFGPLESYGLTVKEISHIFLNELSGSLKVHLNITQPGELANTEKESLHLMINSQEANQKCGWQNIWSPEQAVERTAKWWNKVLKQNTAAASAINSDIVDFFEGHKTNAESNIE